MPLRDGNPPRRTASRRGRITIGRVVHPVWVHFAIRHGQALFSGDRLLVHAERDDLRLDHGQRGGQDSRIRHQYLPDRFSGFDLLKTINA